MSSVQPCTCFPKRFQPFLSAIARRFHDLCEGLGGHPRRLWLVLSENLDAFPTPSSCDNGHRVSAISFFYNHHLSDSLNYLLTDGRAMALDCFRSSTALQVVKWLSYQSSACADLTPTSCSYLIAKQLADAPINHPAVMVASGSVVAFRSDHVFLDDSILCSQWSTSARWLEWTLTSLTCFGHQDQRIKQSEGILGLPVKTGLYIATVYCSTLLVMKICSLWNAEIVKIIKNDTVAFENFRISLLFRDQ